jgi:hypothetical protein
VGLRSRARRVCSERRETLQAKGAGRNRGLLWRTPDIAELQFARGEAVAHLLELEPNFRITEWATRNRLSKLQIFIDGLRKAVRELPPHWPRSAKASKLRGFGWKRLSKAVNGAPRPMKMGTIASPSRYDAAARHAFQSANLRRPAILHYATPVRLPRRRRHSPRSGASIAWLPVLD